MVRSVIGSDQPRKAPDPISTSSTGAIRYRSLRASCTQSQKAAKNLYRAAPTTHNELTPADVVGRSQLAQHCFKSFECLRTHMVLDSLGIHGRGVFIHANCHKKSIYRFMPTTTLLGETHTFVCQSQRLIRFGRYETFVCQSLDNSVNRNMADSKPFGQVFQPTNPLSPQDFGDRFHVVFGCFRRMITPCSPMWFRMGKILGHTSFRSAELHTGGSPVV